jgi:antitoxin ParD1/3/4
MRMTAKPTISLTDASYAFAKSLVERGKFASLSAVVQYGLGLVEREEEEHKARLDAIRADLDRRAAQPSISTEDMDARLSAWRDARDRGEPTDLA